ncbi:MAG: ABC transporter ATP-binding protein [Candidatus Bathyarchaeota archaeon]|nr:ABC transporter ATP-binding protein [Candidatus Bathyarchaeota archaeon]
MNTSVVCDDIVKVYNSHKKKVTALDHLSLAIKEGEVFGLLGPNGAGKTTLVRILTTLLKATEGHAEVGGYDVDKEESKVRGIIGYAGQDSERSAYFRLSVQENLLYFAHTLREVSRGTVKERIGEIASAVGFTDRLDRHFSALSGGEKQLVIVMRAILHNPQICFLDEPSKSLDPVTAQRVRRFLKKYARDHGMTVCLTTHNMPEAEQVCDRLAFINQGRLRFVGTSKEFKRRVIVKETIEIDINKIAKDLEANLLALSGVSNLTKDTVVRLYCDNAFETLPDVLDLMKRSGVKAPVRMVEPSLEDAFAFLVKDDENEVNNHA